jgi:hypothetical protein
LRTATLAYDIEASRRKLIPEINAKLHGELGKTQSNLNQIAKHLNVAAKAGADYKGAILAVLKDVAREAEAMEGLRLAIIGAWHESESD